MFTINLKDLKVIIPIIIVIIGAIFSAGMFMQDKFVCVDKVHDAVVACTNNLTTSENELKLQDKYISYLEADAQFNKNKTYPNYKVNNDKKIDLQDHLKKFSLNDTILDNYPKLKKIKLEAVAANIQLETIKKSEMNAKNKKY